MSNAPTDPNPVDDLQDSLTGRIRDALYASEAMLRHRAMKPAPPATAPVDDTLSELPDKIPHRLRPAPEPMERHFPDIVGNAPAPETPASTVGTDPAAAHLEGLALQARGEADDVTTPNVDEAALGDNDFDQYRTMAASHRATFPTPDPGSPARVPAGRVARASPASARRLTARR